MSILQDGAESSSLPGASSRVRQNFALMLGLQGRLAEARAFYPVERPPQKAAEANMN